MDEPSVLPRQGGGVTGPIAPLWILWGELAYWAATFGLGVSLLPELVYELRDTPACFHPPRFRLRFDEHSMLDPIRGWDDLEVDFTSGASVVRLDPLRMGKSDYQAAVHWRTGIPFRDDGQIYMLEVSSQAVREAVARVKARHLALPAPQTSGVAPEDAAGDIAEPPGKIHRLEPGEITIAGTAGVSANADKQRIYINEELDKLNAELAAGREAEATLEQTRLLLGRSNTSSAPDTPQAIPAAAGEVTASTPTPIPTPPKPASVQAARNRKKMTEQETKALAEYRARYDIPESGDKQFKDYTKLCATNPDTPPLKRWMFRTTKAKSGPKSSPRNSRQK